MGKTKRGSGACLAGGERLLVELSRRAAAMREQAPEDPYLAKHTRDAIWGWFDDESAAFTPWGFDVPDVAVPVAIYYDPDETVLPRQHGEWLARNMPHAHLVETAALGHRRHGDPMPDLRRLYAWLIESTN